MKQMIHKETVTNVTTKHKKVLISVKKKLQGGDNICIKYNRQESNFKTSQRMIKKNSKSLKIKWAKRIRGENTPQRNHKHKKNVQRSL